MIRVAGLVVVLALVGCGQSKPDVWSEYATAVIVLDHEHARLQKIQGMLRDDPEDAELKAMEQNSSVRFDVAAKHANEIRSRIPGMPKSGH